MKKRIRSLFAVAICVLSLAGCWNGEVAIDTIINDPSGSGTRTFVLDVIDDTLSTEPIENPDDPDGVEGKGAVINSIQIEGGVPAIQTWLEDHAPEFMTVELMSVEGYHRYFTLTYTFSDFDDFLEKYEILVNLSPSIEWSDFTAEEKPRWVSDDDGFTFTESREIILASLDWAVTGIWNDIYVEGGLAGFVTSNDISVLANYTLTIGGSEIEDLQKYDPEAIDGAGTGAVVYPSASSYSLSGFRPYIVTFMDDDGVTVLGKSFVQPGETAVPPPDPTKAATELFYYVFTGWSAALAGITGDMTVTATFVTIANKYTVKYYDEDGTTLLGTSTVDFGTAPVAPNAPTKAATEVHTYEFIGWVFMKSDGPETLSVKALYEEFLIPIDPETGCLTGSFLQQSSLLSLFGAILIFLKRGLLIRL